MDSYLSDAIKTSLLTDENVHRGVEPSIKSPGLVFQKEIVGVNPSSQTSIPQSKGANFHTLLVDQNKIQKYPSSHLKQGAQGKLFPGGTQATDKSLSANKQRVRIVKIK
jgi:hypothetical protein